MVSNLGFKAFTSRRAFPFSVTTTTTVTTTIITTTITTTTTTTTTTITTTTTSTITSITSTTVTTLAKDRDRDYPSSFGKMCWRVGWGKVV